MAPDRAPSACSRRSFLSAAPSILSLPAAVLLAAPQPQQVRRPTKATKAPKAKAASSVPMGIRYADAATDIPVTRLTDPAFSSYLPRDSARALTRRGDALLYASDESGARELYHADLRKGGPRRLTSTGGIDIPSFTLLPNGDDVLYVHAGSLHKIPFNGGTSTDLYRPRDGFEIEPGVCASSDNDTAYLVERASPSGTGSESQYRLRAVNLKSGQAVTLAEAGERIQAPIPGKEWIVYRRGDAWWRVTARGERNESLALAQGRTGPARLSPDERTLLYLQYPSEPTKLNALRSFQFAGAKDDWISDTTQFVGFDRNADASVFVGASGSLASPYVLLLVSKVQREFTLCEHRCSDPSLVSPVFSPNSQQVYFTSNLHGKPAIYQVDVARFVEQTEQEER